MTYNDILFRLEQDAILIFYPGTNASLNSFNETKQDFVRARCNEVTHGAQKVNIRGEEFG
jgi:hypothetical protein